ncbi:MAG: helix-turn-helix domain-containing protein [Streptosporangiales bacterium]|nr:helix-turn-helix domain-containing protein [Streptosporangiales bacterium]
MYVESTELRRRAAIHAALAEPARLAVVDALLLGDASPGELGEALGLPSNLLAHHLRVLETAGVVTRSRSEADGRRSYLRLIPATPATLIPATALRTPRVVFVCTHNSARSQLAAALWARRSRVPAASAGTHPSPRVHRRAVATARRHGLSLGAARTAHVREVLRADDLVVAVCDNAHEELRRREGRRDAGHLHWSVPDPARVDTEQAFERAFNDIEALVDRLVTAVDEGHHTGRTP